MWVEAFLWTIQFTFRRFFRKRLEQAEEICQRNKSIQFGSYIYMKVSPVRRMWFLSLPQKVPTGISFLSFLITRLSLLQPGDTARSSVCMVSTTTRLGFTWREIQTVIRVQSPYMGPGAEALRGCMVKEGLEVLELEIAFSEAFQFLKLFNFLMNLDFDKAV